MLPWTWSTFYLQIVIFLILYVLLSKFAFKPLFQAMIQRKNLIDRDKLATIQLTNDLIEIEKEKNQVLVDAKNQARSLIDEARNASHLQADAILKDAKAETISFIAKSMEEIEAEKGRALLILNSQIDEISDTIVSKIFQKK